MSTYEELVHKDIKRRIADGRGPEAVPMPPRITTVMSDQEIRARALECACLLGDKLYGATELWPMVAEFEAYIRDGK